MHSVILSHLTGNANVKGAAYGFADADLLAEFYVSIAVFPNSILDLLATFSPFSEIRRRQFNSKLKPFTHMWPWLELGRNAAPKIGLLNLTRQKTGSFHIDAVCQNLDKRVASQLKRASKQGADSVYGYEDTTLQTFREAKRLGLRCLYDLPIGYWRSARRMMDSELERWPDWALTLTGLSDSDEKLSRKDEELRLAEHIFVASTFTANTLKEYKGVLAPIEIIPYGFPVVNTERPYTSYIRNRSLKLLFVGSLSQRKGIADIFTVVERLKSYVDLTVVGSKPTDDCPALNAALIKHRWIPSLAHDQILKLMREHDVLVFPSLFEGFGLVITEAMSQGTPVITTDRTAGPDLIVDNRNGWLIEAGSTEALQEAIEKLLQRPEMIAQVGREAQETARRRPWSIYGHELAQAVSRIS